MPRGKSRQISFREKEELAARIYEAAQHEDLELADFVRKVFRYAFKEYQVAGSLYALRARVEAAEEAKRQVALEKKLAKGKSKSVETTRKRKAS
jgi:hypothetical protein